MISYLQSLPLPRSLLEWAMKKAASFSSSHPNVVAYFSEGYEGSLSIRDSRTGNIYQVPIINNAVASLAFKQIKAGDGSSEKASSSQGLRLYDPGYRNTAVITSGITLIDGEKGIIKYRNYTIEELAGRYKFEEVAHLLIWDHLPSLTEKENFRKSLAKSLVLPELVFSVIETFPRDTLPMLMTMAGLTALVSTDKSKVPSHIGGNIYCGNMAAVDEEISRTLAGIASVVALVYCHAQGITYTQPDPNASFVENLFLMMGMVEKDTGRPNRRKVEILEDLWVLYADHEMTCSTAAFLHVASTLADPINCLIGALTAGYGPLHGGAIDTAYKNMRDIGSPSKVAAFIERVKNKEIKLFGYGHRIYRTVDPRATRIRAMLTELVSEGYQVDPVIDIALEIDRIASVDEYFTSRKLNANADLYGSFVMIALGFPPEFVIQIAQIARISGILAHWREAMQNKPEIWRPQQIYVPEKPKHGKKI